MTFTLLSILIILIGVLAIVDGVSRLRGRRVNSILAIVEIVLGALILLQLLGIVALPMLLIAIALEVVVIILIVTRGTGRGRGYLGLTAVVALLNLVYILHLLGFLTIP
jgi:uncharacterized protein YqgC (DUF456 family)